MSRLRDAIPTRFYCRWGIECTQGFASRSDLASHVVHEHVRTSESIRRGDLPTIERAEEGIGESMSVPGLTNANLSESQLKDAHPNSQEEIPSSLPTPPGSDFSSPLVQHTAVLLEVTSLGDTGPESGHAQDAGVNPTLLSAPSHTPSRPVPLSGMATPRFAALSSPDESIFQAEIPASPDLNELVEQAILHPRKRQKRLANTGGSRMASLVSQISSASSDSHLSVEEHLTQSMDVDVSDGELQLSDLIRPDKLDETGHDEGQHPSLLPLYHFPTMPPQSPERQPFSTQDSNMYAGEIFLTQKVPQSSQASETLDSQPPSQAMEGPSSSRVLSMPPLAQPPRQCHSQTSSNSAEKSTSSAPSSLPFSPAGSSMRQSFYPKDPGEPSSTNEGASQIFAPSLPQSTKPSTRRKLKKGDAFQSRTLSGLSSKPSAKRAPSAQPPSRGSSKDPSHIPHDRQRNELELAYPPLEEGSNHRADERVGDFQSQAESQLPPLQTQAPYQSQDMSFY